MDLDKGLTRYFLFSRVQPYFSDYELLIDTCELVDAHLAYKTIRDSRNIVRLIGWIVLRGVPTKQQDIARLFPNFLVSRLHPSVTYEKLYDSLIEMDGTLGETPLFFSKAHPFVSIKKTLFKNGEVLWTRFDEQESG